MLCSCSLQAPAGAGQEWSWGFPFPGSARDNSGRGLQALPLSVSHSLGAGRGGVDPPATASVPSQAWHSALLLAEAFSWRGQEQPSSPIPPLGQLGTAATAGGSSLVPRDNHCWRREWEAWEDASTGQERWWWGGGNLPVLGSQKSLWQQLPWLGVLAGGGGAAVVASPTSPFQPSWIPP